MRKSPRWSIGCLIVACVASLLAACGSSTNTKYGGAQNHLHDLLALQGVAHTVLAATHIGLYRSADGGAHWAEVAGGAGQPMAGLMIFKLAQSPADPQRVYVLAIQRPDDPNAGRTPAGVYVSRDAGASWQLAAALAAIPAQTVYTIGTGPASANQILTIIPDLAEHGLYESNDAGKSWHALPATPDPHPTGVMSVPGHAGRLALWSASTGLYLSDDNGQSWATANGIQGGIFALSVAGSTIYASGTNGLFVSHDNGASFTLTESDTVFSSVTACAASPNHAYAVTGTGIEVTADGGQTWKPTATLANHPTNATADPANPQTAYVASSFPLGVVVTSDGGAHWKQVIP